MDTANPTATLDPTLISTLTPTQHFVLDQAVQHHAGKILIFPKQVNGGAKKKVLKGLFERALITPCGPDWFVAAEGYDALGVPRPGPITDEAPVDPAVEADVAIAEVSFKPPVRTREHSKQATVVEMLKRPEGATIAQICEATGWQTHTVRGTFAGTLKKKLGLTITSEKVDGVRVYRAA